VERLKRLIANFVDGGACGGRLSGSEYRGRRRRWKSVLRARVSAALRQWIDLLRQILNRPPRGEEIQLAWIPARLLP